jgi:L-asparaginase II
MKSELLLKVKRANLVEREHFGFAALVDKNEKILSQIGDSYSSFFLRSCAKPFQALPIVKSKTYEKFNFTIPELAVCCASHVASNDHIRLIKNILDRIGLDEKYLQCGVHDPIDIDTRNYLIKNELKASQIHNNCSGKHAGMLAVCVNNGWPLENYLDFDHPLQKEILSIIKYYCNLEDKIEKSMDGCSAPIYGMPLYKMGVGFLRLFLSKEANLIKKAYLEAPLLIGGKERLDSSIILASNGRLIAKVGAEGLCVVVNPEEEKALVVKILDSNITARSIVVIESLKQLGWLTSEELSGQEISKLYDLQVSNFRNFIVGEIEPVFKVF